MNKIVSHFTCNPKQLFGIDASGAFITVVLLVTVLINPGLYLGLPDRILLFLLGISASIFGYSLLCCLTVIKKQQLFLVVTGIVNLLYCLLTFGLIIGYYSEMTILGMLYFCFEIIIIFFLACIELKTAKKLSE